DLARRSVAIAAPGKVAELMARLRAAGPEKVLVFTAFRQTLEALARELSGQGIPAAVYHGSLARLDKERAIRAFRDEVPVLVSTVPAGEGPNPPLCHVTGPAALPW